MDLKSFATRFSMVFPFHFSLFLSFLSLKSGQTTFIIFIYFPSLIFVSLLVFLIAFLCPLPRRHGAYHISYT